MGIWNSIFGRQKRAITSASFNIPASSNWTGMDVTETAALGISALYCGIKVVSETVGSLPCLTMEHEADGGKREATEHPLYPVLVRKPNRHMTRPVFFETCLSHYYLYGNSYSEIVPGTGGRKGLELWPIHPTRVQPLRNTQTGDMIYRITELDGSQKDLTAAEVLHVPGLTYDGSVGYKLLTVARETVAFGLASQRFANSLFKNLSRPGGIIEVPLGVDLDDEGFENLVKAFRPATSGENVGSTPILEQGITFNPFSLSTNEQLQFVELQRFYVYEVARLLNVPPAKLHSLEKASFASLTEQNREFVNSLNPTLTKFEAELERKLFTDGDHDRFYIEFNTDCLTRADQNSRYTAHQSACGQPWKTINEVRAEEGYPSLGPDYDVLPDEATQTVPAPQPYPTVDPLKDANPDPENPSA